MPLIVICGFPCTGKTFFSNQLVDFLKSRIAEAVVLVNEESLNVSKFEDYENAQTEKSIRARFKNAVSSLLTVNTYVIVDSLNYIKGFRYELYCIARSLMTPQCTCWIECEKTEIIRWNRRASVYNSQTLMDLISRFEPPNAKNRWEFPLFRVVNQRDEAVEPQLSGQDLSSSSESIALSGQGTTEASGEAITSSPAIAKSKSSWKARKNKNIGDTRKPKDEPIEILSDEIGIDLEFNREYMPNVEEINPENDDHSEFKSFLDVFLEIELYCKASSTANSKSNISTAKSSHGGADLLYELDRITQIVIRTITNHQNNNDIGVPLVFGEYDRNLTLYRFVSANELQRFRTQFVKAYGQIDNRGQINLGSSFIDYLVGQL